MTDRLIAKYGTGRNGHAHFAPSSAHAWLRCSGYLLANAAIADVAGEDAAVGTVAHSVAQVWRDNAERPNRMIGLVVEQDAFKVEVTSTMLDYVEQYIQWCDAAVQDGDEVFIERQFSLSHLMPIPDQFGTCDHVIMRPGALIISDLKYGTGVRVHVENNEQTMLYALGAFEEYDWIYGFKEITLRICQVRLGYFGTATITRAQLLAFAEHVRERAAAAWREDAPRTPGEKQCRFCGVRSTCPAISMHLDVLADEAFDEDLIDEVSHSAKDMAEHEQAHLDAVPRPPKLPKVARLTTEFLASRYRYRKMFEKWFREQGEELLKRAMDGEDIPRFKLVNGRRSFKWRSPVAAGSQLATGTMLGRDEAYTTEVISVSVAKDKLRALGWKPKAISEFLDQMVEIVPGRPTLAPVDDERDDANKEADDAFGDEDLVD